MQAHAMATVQATRIHLESRNCACAAAQHLCKQVHDIIKGTSSYSIRLPVCMAATRPPTA